MCAIISICLMSWPTVGWALTHQSLIKEMPYRIAYSLITWRHFLHPDSLLSDDSSLCQVDINLGRTRSNVVAVRWCSWTQSSSEPSVFCPLPGLQDLSFSFLLPSPSLYKVSWAFVFSLWKLRVSKCLIGSWRLWWQGSQPNLLIHWSLLLRATDILPYPARYQRFPADTG